MNWNGISLSLLGLAFYFILFLCFRWLYSRFLTPPYSLYDLLDISNKSVSASHAVISTMAGLVITTSIGEDIKYQTVWATNAFAWFGFPYFAYDLWSMFNVFKHIPLNQELSISSQLVSFLIAQPIIIIHHIILFALAFPLTVHYRHNLGDYFIGFMYLAEMSTPFVSCRAIMSKRGMKDSTLYVVNGILMMITFFICRVCIFPYLYYVYAQWANLSYYEVVTTIPLKCNIGSLLFFSMQSYWFFVMVRGALKLLVREKHNHNIDLPTKSD